ncbi:glycosyltransferase family 39 protein [bacterium]|nr:glycosyltransferase family 39 protein [bacterium]
MTDRNEKTSGVLKVIALLFLLACLVAILYTIFALYALVGADTTIQVQWDMAYHGYWGAKIATDVLQCAPLAFIADCIQQRDYPFLHSLIISPFIVLGESPVVSASLASFSFYALTCFLLFFMMTELMNTRKTVAGLSVCLIMLSSPIFFEFSVLIMLEIFGSAVTLLSLFFYCRALKSSRPKHFTLAFLTATLVFFLKYNYGLILILSLFLMELCLLPNESKRAILSWLRAHLRIGSLRSVENILITFLVCLLVSIIVTRGYDLKLFSLHISLYNLQNPTYLLFILILIKGVRLYRAGTVVDWKRLAPRHVRFVQYIILPVVIWLLLPGNLDAFVDFSVNRSSGYSFWSPNNVFYYVISIRDEYCLTPGIFYLLAAFYLISLGTLHRKPRSFRVLHLYFLLFFLLVTLHPYKVPRFIFPAVPVFWLLALAEFFNLLKRRWGDYILLVCLICFGIWQSGQIIERMTHFYRTDLYKRTVHWFTTNPSLQPALSKIVIEAEKHHQLVILGTFNELSPKLIEWNYLMSATLRGKQFRYDLKKEKLDQMIKNKEVGCIVCLKVLETSPFFSEDYILHNFWKQSLIEEVVRDSADRIKERLFLNSVGLEMIIIQPVS